ncbi:MAG TPA: glycosyltransferase family A protein [Thermoanaerobaculia bacterium]|nr:glycosyltransferase family A protein [Thermoanaerobaculia bacterium]
MPFFSILTATVNRATLLPRAIESLRAQDDGDWEMLVIDSASTDGSRDVVREYASRDPRIRLITEEVRRGVCPARNLGVDAARGEWLVVLDSDDEMAPGALSMFRRRIEEQPDVDQHRFMCKWDDGSLSPRPPLREERWGYEDFLRFMDRCAEGGNTETIACVRAETFRSVRYPEDRSYETLYHLEWAKRFSAASHAEVARLYHTDATDQNSFAPNPAHWLRVAPDHARSLGQVLERHGEAMRRVAPRAYREQLRSAAKFFFLAGERKRALALLLQHWRVAPFSPLSWGIFAFGMLGRRPLAWADAARAALRRS